VAYQSLATNEVTNIIASRREPFDALPSGGLYAERYFAYKRNPIMIAELNAVLTTAKATIGLLKTLQDVNKDEAVRSAVFDIQSNLLSLQEKLFEANDRFAEQSAEIADLKEKLASFQRWEETRAKYQIVELYEGRYAYKMRNTSGDIEDKLRYCATCFESGKLRLLQIR
jgi:ATPase subunit of ABC transporter with duplicated ATPase domains